MGPMAQGPGGLARVTAKVQIQQPHVRRNLGETITFAIRIPLIIELIVDLWLDKQRFIVDGEIRRFVAAYVAEEIDSPASQQAKLIDVATQVAGAWDPG